VVRHLDCAAIEILEKRFEWLQNGLYGECPASQGGAAEAMLRKLGAASCIPALAYNPARSMNYGSNAHSYRNSFYGVSSGSSRSACTDLLCKGVDKKGPWLPTARV
jgi:hypothetical protein